MLGDVGDGCSCFSIVSFTSSCYKRTHSSYKYASVVLTLSQTHISSPHLHTIQHAFDHRGDGCHGVLVVEVDALQHHLVGPTNEIRQTLIDAVMTGGHCRAAERERENNGERLHASCKIHSYTALFNMVLGDILKITTVLPWYMLKNLSPVLYPSLYLHQRQYGLQNFTS